MNYSIMAYIISAGAVALAEMADKTQLMAMAFASKYKVSKVSLGVFLSIVFSQGMAVAMGNYMGQHQGLNVWIQAIASLSFIFFGLWTMRGEKSEDMKVQNSKFGVVITVAIAFFIAELGDKTQLATIAFAIKYPSNPISVLLGTITGMVVANALGIFVGVVLCKRIPEEKLKFLSAGAFILFGFIGVYQVMADKLNFTTGTIAVIMILIALITGTAMYFIFKNREIPEKRGFNQYCRIKGR
ncbi:MAG TPA: TMEM165/GDT1 family protein [Clostridiales bacterium]|nr:TMEM165/GDT1 family protein [Clostridiales bacterium]